MEKEAKHKKRIHRSPGYPMISLSEAIEKVKMLWENDKGNPVPLNVALKYFGYSSPSGPGARMLAALKQFNLISSEQGRILLTEEGRKLSIYPPSDDRYKEIIRELALKPNIYETVFREYADGLPSDETLRVELIDTYKFNPYKVDRFLQVFRETIEFAGLSERAEEPEGVMEPNTLSKQPSALVKLINSFPVRLKDHNQATITFNRLPVDKADLELLKKWIDLMKDNLTEKNPADSDPNIRVV